MTKIAKPWGHHMWITKTITAELMNPDISVPESRKVASPKG